MDRRILNLLITLTALVGTATAIAAVPPQDQQAARQIAVAWRDYFTGAAATLPQARTDVDQFAAATAAACPDVLVGIDTAAMRSWPTDAVATFFAEFMGDVDLVSVRSARAGVPALAGTVAQVQWSTQRRAARARSVVAAWKQYVEAEPSDICADARALASSQGRKAADASNVFADELDKLSDGPYEVDGLVATRDECWLFGDAPACLGAGRADVAALRHVYGQYETARESLANSAEGTLAAGLGLPKLWAEYEVEVEDANAKSDARNMVSEVESCYSDTQDYRRCNSPGELGGTGLEWGSGPGEVKVTRATRSSYRISAHSKSGSRFVITKRRNGSLSYTCSRRGVGACGTNGHW